MYLGLRRVLCHMSKQVYLRQMLKESGTGDMGIRCMDAPIDWKQEVRPGVPETGQKDDGYEKQWKYFIVIVPEYCKSYDFI